VLFCLFTQCNLIGCSAPDILALFTSGRKQNGFPVTDEQMFVLNEAAASQNIKKATKFCLIVRGGIL
jgi:hypothetical protein